MIKPIVTAFRTLTIVPVPGKDTDPLYRSLPWFTLVGIFCWLIHLLAFDFLKHLPPNLFRFGGLTLCGLNYAITGAMHLDGLADTADAFGTKHDKESTLRILKDSHTGVFGTSAVVFAILWRVTVYQQLIEGNALIWILYALVFSRLIQGLLLSLLPYGRDNQGKAFPFSGPSSTALILGLEMLLSGTAAWRMSGAETLLISSAAGSIGVFLIVSMFLKRLGGITGDGVGASSELFELLFLTGAVAYL